MTTLPDLASLNENTTPFAKHLGLRITAASKEKVEGEITVSSSLCTRPDVMHGGAIMGVADNMGATGTVLNLREGHFTTTIESKTNFLRPVPMGTLARAVSTPVHRGRTTMVWRTDILTEEGKLAATVTQTQMVIAPPAG